MYEQEAEVGSSATSGPDGLWRGDQTTYFGHKAWMCEEPFRGYNYKYKGCHGGKPS